MEKSVNFCEQLKSNSEDNFEEILFEITLNKPKSALHVFLEEKWENLNNNTHNNQTEIKRKFKFFEVYKLFKDEWKNLSIKEKNKYLEKYDAEIKKFDYHFNLVNQHLIAPSDCNVSAFDLFVTNYIEEEIQKDKQPEDARKEAHKKWGKLKEEEKRYWEDKRIKVLFQNLNISKYPPHSFNLFIQDQWASSKIKCIPITNEEIFEKWRKLKPSIKNKYKKYAEEVKTQTEMNREVYELAFGNMPRKPLGARILFMKQFAKNKKDEKGSFSTGKEYMGQGFAKFDKLWNELPEDDKKIYFRMEHKEKLIYKYKKYEKEKSEKANTKEENFEFDKIVNSIQTNSTFSSKIKLFLEEWKRLDLPIKKDFNKRFEDLIADTLQQQKLRVYKKPTIPPNHYALWIKHIFPEIKRKFKKLSNLQIFEECKREWKQLSEINKNKFYKKHDKLMKRYYLNLKEWKEKGFYIPEREIEGKKKKLSKFEDPPVPDMNNKKKNKIIN